MKRVLSLISMFFMVGSSFAYSDVPQEIEYEEPIEIVETVRIKPDVITLLKEEVRATPDWDKGCEDTTIQLSYEDAQWLMAIAWSEAGNQGVLGQLKIMEVVWNRVNSDEFPNTIREVILQDNQFTTVSNGSFYKAIPTYETHLALAEFEKNRKSDDEIVGFETVKNGSTLSRYFDVAYVHQDHRFYKLKND